MARIRVETGKSAGKSVDFDKQMIVGRGETAGLQIHDLKASREHCRVFDQGGTWAVADLNSRNGIKVNGVATTRKNLSHGDRIESGETVMVFEISTATETADAVPPVKAGGKSAAPAAPAAPAAKAPAPATAPKPSAPAAKPSSPAAKSDASDRKAAAMAAARADAAKAKGAPGAGAKGAAATSKGGAAAPKAGAAQATGQGVEISDRALQFHKVDTKKATLLDVDLTQSDAMSKFLIFLGCAAFLGLMVWLFSTLVSE